AARMAATKTGQVHVVLVPRGGSEPEEVLIERVKEAGREAGRWLHTDVMAARNPAELAKMTHADVVFMGYTLTDEIGVPLDDIPGAERMVVVVRGAPHQRADEDAKPDDRAMAG